MKAKSLALLTEQGSLTELMKQLMGAYPLLNCLSEGMARTTRDERQLLDISSRNLAHVREITMGTSETDWLFARTVIPKSTLKQQSKRLSKMRGLPLGKVLFGSLNAKRVQLRLDIVFVDEVGLEEFDIPLDFPLWQRRSIFEVKTGPILITEIFLPGCPIYAEQ